MTKPRFQVEKSLGDGFMVYDSLIRYQQCRHVYHYVPTEQAAQRIANRLNARRKLQIERERVDKILLRCGYYHQLKNGIYEINRETAKKLGWKPSLFYPLKVWMWKFFYKLNEVSQFDLKMGLEMKVSLYHPKDCDAFPVSDS